MKVMDFLCVAGKAVLKKLQELKEKQEKAYEKYSSYPDNVLLRLLKQHQSPIDRSATIAVLKSRGYKFRDPYSDEEK